MSLVDANSDTDPSVNEESEGDNDFKTYNYYAKKKKTKLMKVHCHFCSKFTVIEKKPGMSKYHK